MHFEHANRPGRYLAYCLRKEKEKNITGIKKGDQIIYGKKEIQEQFLVRIKDYTRRHLFQKKE